MCVVMVVVAGVVVGIWLAARGPARYRGPVEELTLGFYPGEVSAPLLVAEERGFLSGNGLHVIWREYESGSLATQALLRGEVGVATAAEFVLVNNSFGHHDLRVLASITEADVTFLLAMGGKGIENPTHLKGKTIGVTRNTSADYFLRRFLAFNGLQDQDVVVEDISPPDLEEALLSGRVDAVATWDPYAFSIGKQLGGNGISWSVQGGQDFYWLLISERSLIDERPEVVERLLKSVQEAESFIASNQQEAKVIAAVPMGLDQDYMDYCWPRVSFSLSLQQVLLLIMEDEARWVIGKGLTAETTPPNYLDFIYLEGLEKVKPEAVTIIH